MATSQPYARTQRSVALLIACGLAAAGMLAAALLAPLSGALPRAVLAAGVGGGRPRRRCSPQESAEAARGGGPRQAKNAWHPKLIATPRQR